VRRAVGATLGQAFGSVVGQAAAQAARHAKGVGSGGARALVDGDTKAVGAALDGGVSIGVSVGEDVEAARNYSWPRHPASRCRDFQRPRLVPKTMASTTAPVFRLLRVKPPLPLASKAATAPVPASEPASGTAVASGGGGSGAAAVATSASGKKMFRLVRSGAAETKRLTAPGTLAAETGDEDVLDSAARALSLGRHFVSKGYEGPLKPHNQLAEDRCVCASMATAMWLRAVLTARGQATREYLRRNLASAGFLYDAQRRLACRETARCDCGPACAEACDPHCGSLLSNVERIARQGTVFATDFPDSSAGDLELILRAQQPSFLQTHPTLRLEIARKRRPDASGAKAQRALTKLLRAKCPCLLNMYVYPNQMKWARGLRRRTDKDGKEDLRAELPWTS